MNTRMRLWFGILAISLAVVLGLIFPTVQASKAAGGIIYVDADATGAGDGSAWADAFTDLQPALEAALSGDQIWVAAGTYTPSLESDPDDPRSASFQMKNGVAIYGGFAGGETELEQRDWVNNPTILSGDIGVVGEAADNSYHVFYPSIRRRPGQQRRAGRLHHHRWECQHHNLPTHVRWRDV